MKENVNVNINNNRETEGNKDSKILKGMKKKKN